MGDYEYRWKTPSHLWQHLKPLARQMRHDPTPAEAKLWQHLRCHQQGVKFRRQHAIERFIVDFYASSIQLAIEVDGPIHDYQPEEDVLRQAFIEAQGITVLRFSNDAVLSEVEAVLDTIQQCIAAHGKT